jgi:amino acid efflux transporter
VAGDNSLWAWPALILLVFPIAIVFAVLGRHFPSAGGVAHFVNMAFGSRMERVTGWLFLSVIPVGLPAALHIATGFGQALFGWHDSQLLLRSWVRWPSSGGSGRAAQAPAPIYKRWSRPSSSR